MTNLGNLFRFIFVLNTQQDFVSTEQRIFFGKKCVERIDVLAMHQCLHIVHRKPLNVNIEVNATAKVLINYITDGYEKQFWSY